jgi:hypothetical protein
MNSKRWRIVLMLLGTFLVFFGLGLLYRVTHRGYPPTVPLAHCVFLALRSCYRFFFTSFPGILVLLGFVIWFCSSPTEDRRR